MVASVEAQVEQRTSNWQTAEYALSLDRLRMVGNVALSGIALDAEAQGSLNQLRAEFDTSLAEMLKTDPDFGKELEITRFETYEVREGQAISHDSVTPVVDMLQHGVDLSEALAESDPRMHTQAVRDNYDLSNAIEVDAMVAGRRDYNTRIVASLLPAEAIERDGEDYWRGMGYFPETQTAFFQLYHLTEEGELLTGTLSVDATDQESMRQLLGEIGVAIPEGELTDNWLQYAFTDTMTTDQAKQFIKALRQRHYEAVGHVPTKPTSVEEVLAANAEVVNQSFEELQIPLGESLAGRKKATAIQSLLRGFMQNSVQLGSEVRSGLVAAYNRDYFRDTDARLVYKLIMYATVEEIRKSLPLSKKVLLLRTIPDTHNPSLPRPDTAYVSTQLFINQLVQSALDGATHNRSYGACGTEIKISNYASDDNSPEAVLKKLFNPQDVFGGKATDTQESQDEDEHGPLVFQCTDGHTNRRQRGKLIDECQHRGCKGSVGCD